jgi:signal transduction histidine kinase
MIAFILLLTSSFIILYRAPILDISVDWKTGRVTASESWSAFQPEDRIQAINGLKITSFHLLMDNIHIGSRADLFSWFKAKQEIYDRLQLRQVSITLDRQGKTIEVIAEPRKAGMSFLRNLEFIHLISGILFFLIGTVTLYKAGLREQAMVFHAMCLILSIVFETNATSLMAEIVLPPVYFIWINIVNILALPIGNALILHFSLLLPRKRKILERFPWIVLVFYSFVLPLTASLFIPALNFCTALFSILSVISILHAFFVYRNPLDREQMKWVAIGFVIGLAPWVFMGAIPMLIIGERLVKDTIPAAFVVFLPLSMAFAIQKYRLMNVNDIFEGTFVYGITVLLLGVADLSLMGLWGSIFEPGTPMAQSFGIGSLTIIMVVAVYAPLRDWVRILIRRIFRREFLDEGTVLSSFSDRTSGQSPDEILQSLTICLEEVFRPSCLIAVTGETGPEGRLFQKFSERSEPVLLWEDPSPDLPHKDIVMALPVRLRGDLNFLILLGTPQRGGFYTRDRIQILKALLSLAEILLENADLHEQNLREAKTSLEKEKQYAKEKEKIVQDLHDGVGGIMTNIHILSCMTLQHTGAGDMKSAVSTIQRLAKEGISEIRGFMKSLETPDINWESLSADLRFFGKDLIESNGMTLTFHSDIQNPKDAPGSLLFLNISRIYKEFLTNVVRHSKAKNVQVELKANPEKMTLSMRDDGVGLAQTVPGNGIAGMKKRAMEVNGTISLTTGDGTCLDLEIPLPGKYTQMVEKTIGESG